MDEWRDGEEAATAAALLVLKALCLGDGAVLCIISSLLTAAASTQLWRKSSRLRKLKNVQDITNNSNDIRDSQDLGSKRGQIKGYEASKLVSFRARVVPLLDDSDGQILSKNKEGLAGVYWEQRSGQVLQSHQPANILTGKGTVVDKISHIAYGQKPIGFQLGHHIIAVAQSKNPVFEISNALNEYMSDDSRWPSTDIPYRIPSVLVSRSEQPICRTFWDHFMAKVAKRDVAIADFLEERMVPAKSELTCIGHLNRDDKGTGLPTKVLGTMTPCRDFPFLSLESREQIEEKMSALCYRWLYICLALGTTACAAGFYAYCHRDRWLPQFLAILHQRRGKNDSNMARRNLWSQLDNERDEDVGDICHEQPEGELCCVCFSRRRSVAFIACGHHICCAHCALQIARRLDGNAQCPVCNVRTSPEQIVRIFS